MEVHLKFKMVPESLYMTIQIIDRYLEIKTVRRSRLQLVGVAALLVSGVFLSLTTFLKLVDTVNCIFSYQILFPSPFCFVSHLLILNADCCEVRGDLPT